MPFALCPLAEGAPLLSVRMMDLVSSPSGTTKMAEVLSAARFRARSFASGRKSPCWQTIDALRKSRGLHSVSAYRHGLYIYRSMPAGVAQSSHAFVGGTVSTWTRLWIPVNKGRKGIRNADQALTVRREHADRIEGSPIW